MNVINVGFDSNYWSVLVEGSDDYKVLSLALENGDSKTAKHMLNTINGLVKGDYNNAYREAHYALKSSQGGNTDGDETVVCPFCGGDGVVEFEHVPTDGGYQDPTDAVDAEAPCNACNGNGNMQAIDLIDNYAEESYPEHVVMSVIRGDMIKAKSLAQAVVAEIKSHDGENFDNSVDAVGE